MRLGRGGVTGRGAFTGERAGEPTAATQLVPVSGGVPPLMPAGARALSQAVRMDAAHRRAAEDGRPELELLHGRFGAVPRVARALNRRASVLVGAFLLLFAALSGGTEPAPQRLGPSLRTKQPQTGADAARAPCCAGRAVRPTPSGARGSWRLGEGVGVAQGLRAGGLAATPLPRGTVGAQAGCWPAGRARPRRLAWECTCQCATGGAGRRSAREGRRGGGAGSVLRVAERLPRVTCSERLDPPPPLPPVLTGHVSSPPPY